MDETEAAVLYRSTLEEMAALREGTSKVGRWNRLVDRNQTAHLVLRSSPEGRQVIEDLMGHDEEVVRSWAATHALMWNEPMARPVLEALAAGHGLTSLSAKYTLLEFDAGTLITDW